MEPANAEQIERTTRGRAARFLGALLAGWFRQASGLVTQVRTRREPSLKVEEKLSLGSQKQVFVILCHGQRFLLATGSESVSSLIAIEPACERRRPLPHVAGGRASEGQARKVTSL